MFKCQPLPLTVPHVPGESAMSLASRLARRNGVPRMLTFCSDVGLDVKELTNGSDMEITRLAQLAGCDADVLRRWTPQLIDEGLFRLGRETLKFTCFERTHSRVCPVCVREARDRDGVTGPAHLGSWQLKSVRSCHRHHCLLIETPAPENRGDMFDYAQRMAAFSVDNICPVAETDLQLGRWLLSRIEHGPGTGWLDSLPAHVATQTCENFGLLVAFGPKIKRSEITASQWLRAGAAGFEILLHGPNAMTDTLKSIQLQRPVDTEQYRTRYRIFFHWLRDRNDDPAFDGIREMVRDFIWSNYPVPKGGLVLGKPCPKQYVHSPATAAKTYGVSRWKVEQRLLALGHAKKPEGGRHVILPDYLNTALIKRVVRDIQALWSAKKTAAFLGVELATLRLLAKAGFLRIEMKLGSKAPYYNSRKVAAFITVLRQKAVKTDTDIPTDAVSFSEAAIRCQCRLGDIVGHVQTNELRLYAENPETATLHDLKVSVSDIRETAANGPNATASLSEAASLLCTDTRTVRALVNSGYLTTVSPFAQAKQHRWRIIDMSSIDAFSRDYISLNALSHQGKQSPATLSQRLYKRGIPPLLSGNKIQRFFRRSDTL